METKQPVQIKLTDAQVMDRLRAIVKTGIDPGTGRSVDSRTRLNAYGLLESMERKPRSANPFYKYVGNGLPNPGNGSARKNE